MEKGKTMHIGVAKRFLLLSLPSDPFWREATDPPWDGTLDELLETIRSDPREVFTDCDCRKDESGACIGVLDRESRDTLVDLARSENQ